jgi:hypothetical protein
MNCYYHNEVTSVAACPDCSKGLCRKCSDNFNIPICTSCNIKRASSEKSEIIIEFAWMIGAGILGLVFLYSLLPFPKLFKNNWLKGILPSLWMFYVFACFVTGWKALSKFTSKYFLFLPLIGWVIYFFIKLYIALFVGVFIAPFKIFKNIKKLRSNQNIIQLNNTKS